MNFTKDQQKVIELRGKNILVSAAAGSGKTAVLVERILALISDSENPVDIDRLLVVTFTNAAAAEMRERIHSAILKKLEENPDDVRMQRQAVLVHHAQITTIDSFCLFILQNHFQQIDLEPGFQVGDPGKIKLIFKEAMGKVLEDAYAGAAYYDGFEQDFLRLADVFARKGKDTAVEEMIERLYHFSMSLPWPEKWLRAALFDYEAADEAALFGAPFMEYVVTDVSQKLRAIKRLYEAMLSVCLQADGPDGYCDLLKREQEELCNALQKETYDSLREAVLAVSFGRLPALRKDTCNEEKKEQVKQIRERCKKRLAALKELYFFEEASDMALDMRQTGSLLKPLIYLTLSFMEQFAKAKAKENLIDFSDMEHFALEVLVDENGEATDTAKQYQDYYAQVMIDEYQDSNEVQELLLSVVSREKGDIPDRFMVGDMKQSIYKFRMARPEIFLEKYTGYAAENENHARIDLKKNFRSRREVIETVNNLFYPLMRKEVGGISYDADAALYVGAQYPEPHCPEPHCTEPEYPELHCPEAEKADGSAACGAQGACEEEQDGACTEKQDLFATELLVFEKDEENTISGIEGEALMIAAKIKDLMAGGRVTDKESGMLRPVAYEDIVILVRSTGGLLDSLQDVLKKEGIPASVPSRTGYFGASEVQVMLKLLEVLVNPGKDIPLAAVLKSPLYAFTDEELSRIALCKASEENDRFYAKLKKFVTQEKNGKADLFLTDLKRYRKLAKTETVHDLLYLVIREHRYLEYVTALPAGSVRRANVEMLLEKAMEYEKLQMHGVFGFLQYMKQLEKYEIDYGEGNDENSHAVRLMTIHKSKGLEFPICFVAGLSKQFNKRDLSGSLLLHTDLGIGMEYRNPDSRVKRKTIKQKVVADRMKTEELGEELRVFYVALTRAKEKLIMTGVSDDYAKALEGYKNLNAFKYLLPLEDRKLEPELILECNSYFKLLLAVLSLYQDAPDKLPALSVYHEDCFALGQLQEQFDRKLQKEMLLQQIAVKKQSDKEQTKEGGRELSLAERIAFSYPHKELAGLYTKTSVSELKMAALHEDEQTEVLFETQIEESVVPAFMQKEQKAKGAARGTAYHRLMELLDFKAFCGKPDQTNTKQILETQIEEILKTGAMTREALELVDRKKVTVFLQSELAGEMAEADKAGRLYREQPFVMQISAARVGKGFPQEETMLIQGIMDAYYEKEGGICLLDYKTDRVNKKEDLIQRYQTQLDYYKEALEKLTGKKVMGVYIYSYCFLESIAI